MTLDSLKDKISFYGVDAVRKQFQAEKEFCKSKMLELDISMDSVGILPDSMVSEADKQAGHLTLQKQKEIMVYRFKKSEEHLSMIAQAEKAIEADAVIGSLKS